jgi:trimethylamine:corrinoid methyltransferase-like protein
MRAFDTSGHGVTYMKQEETQLIHETSLKILEEIGVKLEHDEVAARVIKAGAKAGADAQVVTFPRGMVEEYMKLAPGEVKLDDRQGTGATLSCDCESVFWTNPGLNIREGKEVREISSSDLADIARLCDHLEGVHGVMGMAMNDVTPRHRDFTGVRVIAENTRKHIRALCFTPTGMEALLEMKSVFPGNWLSIGFTAHGPLRWTNLALGIFLKSAGAGIPATINGEPMAGVSGPVSLAGSAAVGNAEILSGIVINQVLEPGRPVIHNLGLAHAFDMKDAAAITGGPENAMLAVIGAEMGRFYNLPSSSWVSTESVFDDSQASMEKMFGIHTHTHNKVSLIWGLGQLESEKTISLAQLVLDDEMIAYARHYNRGAAVTPETVNYELIKEVGIGGSYLETEDTLFNYREHLWIPGILNRKPREACPAPLEEIAAEKAREILAEDTEDKIGADELAELKKIEEKYAALIS